MASSSVAQLSQKFSAAANAIPSALERGVFTAALEGKDVTIDAYTAAGVSRTGSRLGKWSVGFDIKGFLNPTALLQVRGRMMHLFDFPTKGHSLAPKRRKRGRKSKAMRMPPAGPGEWRQSAQHPGTSGANVFHGQAVPKMAERTPDIYRRAVIRALAEGGFGR